VIGASTHGEGTRDDGEVGEAMSDKSVPKKRRRWIWWVVLAVVVIAAAVFVLRFFTTSSNSVNNYSTAQVTKENLTVTASGSGNITVGSAVSVEPGISGTVEDLAVKLGQKVDADDLLFRIVNDDLDAAVEKAQVGYEQAEQGVYQAKAQLTQAKNNLYNLQHPSQVGTQPVKAASSREITLAKQQVASAEEGLDVAYGNLSTASTALSAAKDDAAKRTVKAPVAGMITVLNAQNGQQLGSTTSASSGSSSGGSNTGSSSSGSSNSAVEISDMGTLRASISINEVDLVNVKTGQKATVSIDALPGQEVSGTVVAISPTGTNSSGVITYDVDLKLARIDARLRPTMSCSADIVTKEVTSALVVPTSAIQTTNGQSSVQVLDIGAYAPRQVAVTTGVVVGTQTQVTSGLKEGQYVVTGTATGSTSTTGTTSTRRGVGGGFLFGGGPRD
jgi:membrane fusion protein, macrolide-specific efflux system